MKKNHQPTNWFQLPNWSNPRELLRTSLVTALYIVLTLVLGAQSFGPVQFRISEGLNFLGLYNRRYVYAITLGVMISNMYEYGLLDVVVGGLSTFFGLIIGRWLGDKVVQVLSKTRWHSLDMMIVRYAVLIVWFSLSMFTIAIMLYFVVGTPFWPTYAGLVASEFVVLTLGSLVMYPLSKRIDLNA